MLAQLRNGTAKLRLARVEHDDLVCHGERLIEMLLHDQQRSPRIPDTAERLVHLLGDHGGQSQRQLVGDQQARGEHEDPSQREHPLLAARERARGLATAFPEAGEEVVCVAK